MRGRRTPDTHRAAIGQASTTTPTEELFQLAVNTAMKIEDPEAQACCALMLALIERSMSERP